MIAAAHIGAVLPGEDEHELVGSKIEPTDATMTAREQKLQAKIDAYATHIQRMSRERDGWVDRVREADKDQARAAGMLTEIAFTLDRYGKVTASDQTTVDRVRALIRYVNKVENEGGHYGTLCSEAHAALTAAGIPLAGQPADRIRILAERHADPLTPRLRGIAAELLADLEDVTDAGEPWGAHLVRALRLAVGVES